MKQQPAFNYQIVDSAAELSSVSVLLAMDSLCVAKHKSAVAVMRAWRARGISGRRFGEVSGVC